MADKKSAKNAEAEAFSDKEKALEAAIGQIEKKIRRRLYNEAWGQQC